MAATDGEVVISDQVSGADGGDRGGLTRSVSKHRVVSPFKYVRTQAIGLRSSSSSFSATPVKPTLPRSRTSVAFPQTTAIDKALPETPLPPPRIHRRADSVPVTYVTPQFGEETALSTGLDSLPSDPKTWRPAQLATYLAHLLKLTPRPIVEDVLRFVNAHGITGKRFLRMQNADFREIGLNIAWCRIFTRARTALRKECLRQQILGEPDGARLDELEDIDQSLLSVKRAEYGDPTMWKTSWRRSKGLASRGRVKDLAQTLECQPDLASLSTSGSIEARLREIDEVRALRAARGRSDSSASSVAFEKENTVSDDAHQVDWSEVQPIEFDDAELRQLDDVSGEESIHSYERILEYPSLDPSSQTFLAPFPFVENDGAITTVKHQPIDTIATTLRTSRSVEDFDSLRCGAVPSGRTSGRGDIRSLFGVALEFDGPGAPTAEPFVQWTLANNDKDRYLSIRSRDGSMAVISKRKLAELHSKLAAMEKQLEEKQAKESASSEASENAASQRRADWVKGVLHDTEEYSSTPELSWTSLAGWALAAGLGIGIVVGETVLSRLRR